MRYELTGFEWAAIRPLLPNKPRGIPRVDDRRVRNSIFGAAWFENAKPAAPRQQTRLHSTDQVHHQKQDTGNKARKRNPARTNERSHGGGFISAS